MSITTIKQEIAKRYESGQKQSAINTFSKFIIEERDKNQSFLSLIEEIQTLTTKFIEEMPSTEAFILRGMALVELKKYNEALEDFTIAIDLKPENRLAYDYRGWTYTQMLEFEKALVDYQKSHSIDPSLPWAHLFIGRTYCDLGNYEESIKVLTELLDNHTDYFEGYLNRGIAYFYNKNFKEAIADWSASSQLKPKDEASYFNLGLAYDAVNKPKKAIDFYSKSIACNPKIGIPYFRRGDNYKSLKMYDKAIQNYTDFLIYAADNNKYDKQTAEEEIKEIKRIKEDQDYRDISQTVDEIKALLRFDGSKLTHYTSLSTTNLLILKNGIFRLSEAAFLNDTSEGTELYNYLSISSNNKIKSKDTSELFIRKPFIGSFVPETKFDDLTLWRMYGKDQQIEAKGCAITINIKELLAQLKTEISSSSNEKIILENNNNDFSFYRVAYKTNEESEKFIIPGANDKEKKLNLLMKKLAKQMKKNSIGSNSKLQQWLMNKLTEITYLFKTSEYQNEHEIRLVISGIGFNKIIDPERTPPGVYINLVKILRFIERITLGPKVERAEEWAAAFSYAMEKENYGAEIVISHLPFK